MHFLFVGTSGAIPSAERDTTSLVFVGPAERVLVDCGGSPVQKIRRAGLDPLGLTRVVITHLHPDHAYGLPALLQNLHLLGRTAPLPISCCEEHAEPLRALCDLFRLPGRPGMFPFRFEGVPGRPDAPVAAGPDFTVTAAPVAHGRMPNMALRFEAPGGRPVVYSSDTEPCEAVVALARGADTLIHEATFPDRDRGRFGAHSTAGEAGEVAARAGVRRLILVHIEADYHREVDALADEARKRFGGVVEVAREFTPYPL